MTNVLFTLLGHDVTRFAVMAVAGLTLVLLLTAVLCRGVSVRGRLVFTALSVPMSILLGRGFYCAAEAFNDMDSFTQVIDLTRGGYSIMGVMAALILCAWLGEKADHAKGHPLMNLLAVTMPAGLILERLAEAGTGTGLGREVPEWLSAIAVEDPILGDMVHPVYLYETVAAAIILIVMIMIWFRAGGHFTGCDNLLLMLTLFGTSQVFLEAFRNDRHMYIHFVQVEQVIAILLVVIALTVWSVRAGRRHMSGRQLTGLWVFFIALCGMTIFMEFRLDRGEFKLLYYSVIALCMVLACAACLVVRRAAKED